MMHSSPFDTLILLPGVYMGSNNTAISYPYCVHLIGQSGPSSTIIDCQSNTYGLSLDALPPIPCQITNITFQNCVATSGAAIYASDSSQPDIHNCIFINNTGHIGGAIAVNEGEVRIMGSTFTNNTSLFNAGAVWITAGTIATISGSYFYNNEADVGAVIHILGSKLYLYNSTFDGNFATRGSGGIRMEGSVVTINGLNCTRGTSQIEFSCISTAATQFHITNSYFSYNTALLGTVGVDYSRFEDNVLSQCEWYHNIADRGAGIYLKNGAIVTCDKSYFHTNIANTYAGIYNSMSTFTLINSTITNCTANQGTAIGGQGGVTTVINSHIYKNYAQQVGGALYFTASATGIVLNSVIEGNYALSSAGGIYAESLSTLQITNTKFVNNFAQAMGGALQLASTSELLMENCEFYDNVAGYEGGAIYLDTSYFSMNYSTFIGNEAILRSGGGIYIDNSHTHFARDSVVYQTQICGNCTYKDNKSYQNGSNNVGSSPYRLAISSPLSAVTVLDSVSTTFLLSLALLDVFDQQVKVTTISTSTPTPSPTSHNVTNTKVLITYWEQMMNRVYFGENVDNTIAASTSAVIFYTNTAQGSSNIVCKATVSSTPPAADVVLTLSADTTSMIALSTDLNDDNDNNDDTHGYAPQYYTTTTLKLSLGGVAAAVNYFGIPNTYNTLKVSASSLSTVPTLTFHVSTRPCAPGTYSIPYTPPSGTVFLSSINSTYLTNGAYGNYDNPYSVCVPVQSLDDSSRGLLWSIELICMISQFYIIYIVTKYRTNRIIHRSSYRFCLIVLLGTLILLIASIINHEMIATVGCDVKLYLFNFGFTIAFGALFAKTYRLDLIFNNSSLSMNVNARDSVLLIRIIGMLIVDAVICTLWTTVSPYDEDDINVLRCDSASSYGVWLAILLITKAIFVFWCLYIIYKVRNLPANYNESKWIGFCIYNIVFFTLIWLFVHFGIASQLTGATVIIIDSLLFTFSAEFTVLLLFAPKMLLLFLDERQKNMERMGKKIASTGIIGRLSHILNGNVIHMDAIKKVQVNDARGGNKKKINDNGSTYDFKKSDTVRHSGPPNTDGPFHDGPTDMSDHNKLDTVMEMTEVGSNLSLPNTNTLGEGNNNSGIIGGQTTSVDGKSSNIPPSWMGKDSFRPKDTDNNNSNEEKKEGPSSNLNIPFSKPSITHAILPQLQASPSSSHHPAFFSPSSMPSDTLSDPQSPPSSTSTSSGSGGRDDGEPHVGSQSGTSGSHLGRSHSNNNSNHSLHQATRNTEVDFSPSPSSSSPSNSSPSAPKRELEAFDADFNNKMSTLTSLSDQLERIKMAEKRKEEEKKAVERQFQELKYEILALQQDRKVLARKAGEKENDRERDKDRDNGNAGGKESRLKTDRSSTHRKSPSSGNGNVGGVVVGGLFGLLGINTKKDKEKEKEKDKESPAPASPTSPGHRRNRTGKFLNAFSSNKDKEKDKDDEDLAVCDINSRGDHKAGLTASPSASPFPNDKRSDNNTHHASTFYGNHFSPSSTSSSPSSYDVNVPTKASSAPLGRTSAHPSNGIGGGGGGMGIGANSNLNNNNMGSGIGADNVLPLPTSLASSSAFPYQGISSAVTTASSSASSSAASSLSSNSSTSSVLSSSLPTNSSSSALSSSLNSSAHLRFSSVMTSTMPSVSTIIESPLHKPYDGDKMGGQVAELNIHQVEQRGQANSSVIDLSDVRMENDNGNELSVSRVASDNDNIMDEEVVRSDEM